MTKSYLRIMKHVKEEGMMLPGMHMRRIQALYAFSIAMAVLVMLTSAGTLFAAVTQKSFGSAEDAVKALVTAARNNDDNEILLIFGPESEDLIFSGDKIADIQRRAEFLSAYDEQYKLVPEGDSIILVIGSNDFPFPIPIVKKDKTWTFDVKAGREEILNRRIGENELDTIQACLAIVDAQREYAMADRDGDGLLGYAEQFASDPSKKNGLYWETTEGEDPSPLGELFAKARTEGYSKKGSKGNPVPYHGYYYRILKAQGKNAPGGAYNYVVNGKMIGGFAVVAWPAKYGNSGVMTFMVNHDDMVYQKNLGENTEETVKSMTEYDPDKTWEKVQ